MIKDFDSKARAGGAVVIVIAYLTNRAGTPKS